MFFIVLIGSILITAFIVCLCNRESRDTEPLTLKQTLELPKYKNYKTVFIEDYKWCLENLTLKHQNILEYYKDELSKTGDRWDYHFPYRLSDHQGMFGFKELPELHVKVQNGKIFDCTNVEPFIREFHTQVEVIRSRLNPEDVKLYKKYGINYNFLLTDSK